MLASPDAVGGGTFTKGRDKRLKLKLERRKAETETAERAVTAESVKKLKRRKSGKNLKRWKSGTKLKPFPHLPPIGEPCSQSI